MTTADILTDMVLVESNKTATIRAPLERVDIADWLERFRPYIEDGKTVVVAPH